MAEAPGHGGAPGRPPRNGRQHRPADDSRPAPLPAPYESPERRLAADLRDLCASWRLRAWELWRRNRHGDLPRPPFWPERLAAWFWPLLTALGLALVAALLLLLLNRPGAAAPAAGGDSAAGAAAGGDGGSGQLGPSPQDRQARNGTASPGASRPDATDSATAAGELPAGSLTSEGSAPANPVESERPEEEEEVPPAPTAPARQPGFWGAWGRDARRPQRDAPRAGADATLATESAAAAGAAAGSAPGATTGSGTGAGDAEPDGPGQTVEEGRRQVLLAALQGQERQAWVAALEAQAPDGLLRLRLTADYAALAEPRRRELAETWLERAQSQGYERLELLDPGGRLIGRSARVGSGMILLHPGLPSSP